MGLKQIASLLNGTTIENLEDIARNIRAHSQAEYSEKFALEIARQKLEKSGVAYTAYNGEFQYFIRENGLREKGYILVGVSPGLIIPDTRKNALVAYAKKLRQSLNGCSGLIQFFPFQMNGKDVRAILEKEIYIAFINLPYDQKSLERRFRQYCSR